MRDVLGKVRVAGDEAGKPDRARRVPDVEVVEVGAIPTAERTIPVLWLIAPKTLEPPDS